MPSIYVRFSWLIDDSVDTTTSNSHCAYDQIIAAGALKHWVVPGSVEPYLYNVALGLNLTQTEDVSDHFPVEAIVEFNGTYSAASAVAPSTATTLAIAVLATFLSAHCTF
eukprot:m.268579 g.268579  ORF g.268579 m.268579 type:complete len:110 (-) comp19294_c0_seq2:986-1315(-)